MNSGQDGTFGYLPSGDKVAAVTLANDNGMAVTIIGYGAAIQSVTLPDGQGGRDEMTLGYATLEGYLGNGQYAGATVGRVANRIAGGKFMLGGKQFRIGRNDGDNALHGGRLGFDRANWRLERASPESVTLAHTSLDGDQGFPARLDITATYALDNNNRLSVEYLATTDAPTLVNISNHAYWNLGRDTDDGTAMDHLLTILADRYLPVDERLIPTGEVRAVEGTPFDFRKSTRIGQRVRDGSDRQLVLARGYDHNWLLPVNPQAAVRPVARLIDPLSRRMLSLDSNQPGLQFYSGNFFDGSTRRRDGRLVRMGDFIALEPQAFPDTPNQPSFGSIRLDPGDTYRNVIGWTFTTLEDAK